MKHQRTRKIIETYAKMVSVMQEWLPKSVQICFALHIHDNDDRDEDNPDGYDEHLFRYRATTLQRTHFKMMINEYFNSINNDD